MKVAIVLNTSWNIFNFRLGLIKALMKEGFEVITIAPEDKYSEKLESIGCQFYNLTMDSKGISPYKDMRLFFELKRLYKKTKPDVILHFTIKPNIYGSLAAGILGIPSISNVSGLGTVFLWNKPIKLFATLLYKVSFSFVNFVFFQNKDDKELFGELVKLDPNKVDVLPGSGIDISKFHPIEKKIDQHFKFLMIARLIIDKGVYEYIEAAKLLKQQGVTASFQLLGSTDFSHKRGIPKNDIDSWIKDGYIEYLGVTDHVSEMISKADAIVLPSYREGTPRTLLEGGAMEKPFITTDVPGCNNVGKHDYNAFLCQPKDHIDLADKMQRMLSLPEKRYHEMAKNSRLLIEERFDEQIVIKRYLKKIKELLK